MSLHIVKCKLSYECNYAILILYSILSRVSDVRSTLCSVDVRSTLCSVDVRSTLCSVDVRSTLCSVKVSVQSCVDHLFKTSGLTSTTML